MLHRPRSTDEKMAQEVYGAGAEFSHDLVTEAISLSSNSDELTTNLLVVEYAAFTTLGQFMFNTVKQGKGTKEEYKEFLLSEIEKAYGDFEKDENLIATAPGGGRYEGPFSSDIQ